MWWIIGIVGWIVAGGVGASLMGHAVRHADREEAAEREDTDELRLIEQAQPSVS